MTTTQARPWYVSNKACDEYVTALSDGHKFPMLRSLKILKSIIVNLGIIVIGLYSLSIGGDPTIIGFATLALLGGFNGLEYSDYAALLQAYAEVQEAAEGDDAEDGDT